MSTTTTPYQFGANCSTLIKQASIAETLRLPLTQSAARNALISGSIGAGLGGVRGFIWPGYDEKFDEEGRIISKKKIKPWRGALQGAGIGAATGAISNYAAQTAAQYNPEIDKILASIISRNPHTK